MSFLALSSIVALLIKLSLFWVGKSALFRENQPLAFFLVVLFALNAAELMSFAYMGNEQVLLSVLQTYYAAAVIAAAALFYLSMHIIKGSRQYVIISFALSVCIAVLIFMPNVMISGVEPIGYTITRVPGEYFLVLQVYLIGTLLLSIGILFYGVINPTNRLSSKRCLVLLISVSPLVLFTTIITITLSMGIKINGAVIISLMTSLMLVILIYSEKQYRLFKFLSYIPATPEHQLKKQIDVLIEDLIKSLFEKDQEPDLKQIVAQFEASVIKLAIEATNGNKTHAATLLHIGKATLHRKLAVK